MKFKVMFIDTSSPMVHICAYLRGAATACKHTGKKVSPFLIEFTDRTEKTCVPLDLFREESEHVLRMLENPEFFKKTELGQKRAVEAALKFARTLRDRDFKNADNEELAAAYSHISSLFTDMNRWGHIINTTDYSHSLLSNKVLGLLGSLVEKRRTDLSAAEAFGVLTTPRERTRLRQQEYDLYSLLAEVQGGPEGALLKKPNGEILAGLGAFPKTREKLATHARKYDWMQFHYDGPTILGERHFISLLASEARQGTDAIKKISEMQSQEEQTLRAKQTILDALQPSEEEKYWLKVAETFILLKAIRKEAVLEVSRCVNGLLDEISRRLGLDRIQVRHLTAGEVDIALKERKADVKEINERIRHCVWLADMERLTVLTGKEADGYALKIVEDKIDERVTELKGTPAFAGKARGVVKLVEKPADIAKMNEGDVLVSGATNVDLMPALKKASAIVTDAGGVTCHAAIISRELKIPAVIGTKVATKWLKDGDLVEVDATKGKVRRIT